MKLKGFAAGTASGLTKLIVGHPFDTVKLRMQCAVRRDRALCIFAYAPPHDRPPGRTLGRWIACGRRSRSKDHGRCTKVRESPPFPFAQRSPPIHHLRRRNCMEELVLTYCIIWDRGKSTSIRLGALGFDIIGFAP